MNTFDLMVLFLYMWLSRRCIFSLPQKIQILIMPVLFNPVVTNLSSAVGLTLHVNLHNMCLELTAGSLVQGMYNYMYCKCRCIRKLWRQCSKPRLQICTLVSTLDNCLIWSLYNKSARQGGKSLWCTMQTIHSANNADYPLCQQCSPTAMKHIV